MKTEMKPMKLEVTTRRRQLVTKSLTPEQVEPIDLKSFHFCYATCLDTISYKDADGIWIDIGSQAKGIGPVGWLILQAIQLNAGIGLNKKTLIELTGLYNLKNKGVLTQRIKALRAVFGEDKTTERLIVTSNNGEFTVMWPKWASWIWVIPIPNSIPRIIDEQTVNG
jgi:hypothetical protein